MESIISVAAFALAVFLGLDKIVGFKNRIIEKNSIFDKTWTSFHYTFPLDEKINDELLKGRWKFKRDLYNRKTVEVSYPDENKKYGKVKYKGKVVGADGHINILLSRQDHPQFISCRILDLAGENIDAIWFGPDNNGILTSDFWFLTDNELITEKEVEDYIKKGRNRFEGRHRFRPVDT